MNTFINENGIIKVTKCKENTKRGEYLWIYTRKYKDQNEQRQLHKMMERGVEARRILSIKQVGDI